MQDTKGSYIVTQLVRTLLPNHGTKHCGDLVRPAVLPCAATQRNS